MSLTVYSFISLFVLLVSNELAVAASRAGSAYYLENNLVFLGRSVSMADLSSLIVQVNSNLVILNAKCHKDRWTKEKL